MNIVLPVVGAVAGFAIGGPIGALAGFQLGASLGGTFSGGDKNIKLPDQEGPRLSDLRIQTSTYGKVIPEIYGSMRLAGNVIWAQPIKEVKNEIISTQTQSGGKGGGSSATSSQTTVSYSYFCTIAIAICAGPIDEVVRVWADAKILGEDVLQSEHGKYNIYLGTEDQLPDPIIESFEGVGKVPAFRDLAYVVIQDFPLADYGNRIPNFSFEVKRTVRVAPAIEDKVKDIILIPGAGEFVYSTTIHSKQTGADTDGGFVPSGDKISLNMHNFDNVANVNIALDQLQATFPNLEWVSLVVTWFATSTDAGECEIIPKVEFSANGVQIEPDDWQVGALTRATAELVLRFDDDTPTYGGTPSDKSVIDLLVALKDRGLNVAFYPIPFVDQIEPTPKPWRGRIIPANATDASSWFTKTNGYNEFVRHYSQLSVGGVALKDKIDAFIIASELVGMTSFTDSPGSYPAVTQLVNLAGLIKSDVGAGVLTVYAADWSEYHHTDGGWFNMDPLWASSNLDIVGIDAYFPLTPDLPQSSITEAKIQEYWEKGEGWDYFYNTDRTLQTPFGSAVYAWKNLEYWWTHTHTNPNGSVTAWTSKMKPVWFTEFGFPSVDGCANQPNVFYDPTSIESFFPRGSRGRVDFKAQREALNATLDYLEARSQLAGNANLVARRFVWTWDARPFPFWPDLKSVWQDGILWKTGHWVNGKLGNSSLGAIVANLLERVNLSSGDYDTSRLTDTVDGYAILSTITVRDAIEQLQAAYFFDGVESDGLLKFIERGGESAAAISQDELIPLNKDGKIRDTVEIVRKQELDLPISVNITYINRLANYDQGVQLSQRQVTNAAGKVGLNLPLVLTDQQAKTIADVTLYNAWNERNSYKFTLPPAYSLIEPTDIVTLVIDNVETAVRVNSTSMERYGLTAVTAVSEDISTYDFYTPPGEPPSIETPGLTIPSTKLELLDLPPLPSDTGSQGILRLAVSSLGANWTGAVIYRSDDGGESGGNSFDVVSSVATQAVMGAALTALPAGETNVFDTVNTVEVLLLGGTLASVTELAVLNGANVAILGNEVIQFQNAQLVSNRRYILSKLLRGRLGTEHQIGSHTAAERFVLLTSSLVRIAIQNSVIGLNRYYKPVSVGSTLAATAEQQYAFTANSLRPFSPVHITGIRHQPATNDWTINWIRRTRTGGEWRDGVDVPLSEESECYEVGIMDGPDVVRTITEITAPLTVYAAAEQVADFGSVQAELSVRVYQMSAIVGRGMAGIGLF